MKWASDQEARFCVIHGANECEAGTVTLRDMDSGEQTQVPLAAVCTIQLTDLDAFDDARFEACLRRRRQLVSSSPGRRLPRRRSVLRGRRLRPSGEGGQLALIPARSVPVAEYA